LYVVYSSAAEQTSPEHSVFIIEFDGGRFKEITCKVFRKSMRGKKVGQVVLVTLNWLNFIPNIVFLQ